MSTSRLPAGASCLQPSKALRILVAEDDEIQQKILTHVLAPLHFELAIVADGRAALELLDCEPFDLIVMDEQMARMNGLSAVREIRQREKMTNAKRLPIIILSAHASARQRAIALDAGADAHAAKPINPETLINEILQLAKQGRE